MINSIELKIASLKETILVSNQLIADAVIYKTFDDLDVKMDQQMNLIAELIALHAGRDMTDLQSYLEALLEQNNRLRLKIQEEKEELEQSFRNINSIKEYVTA